MSNSKANVADLYAGKLKSLPESSKKLSHVVSKELVKNTKNKKKMKKNQKYKSKQFIKGNSYYNWFDSHKSIQHTTLQFGQKNWWC